MSDMWLLGKMLLLGNIMVSMDNLKYIHVCTIIVIRVPKVIQTYKTEICQGRVKNPAKYEQNMLLLGKMLLLGNIMVSMDNLKYIHVCTIIVIRVPKVLQTYKTEICQRRVKQKR